VGLGGELKKSGAPPHRFQRAYSKRGIPGYSQVQHSPPRRVRITFQRCRTSPLVVQVQPVVRSARPPHRNNITLPEGGVPAGGAVSRRDACASKRRDSQRRARRGRRAKRGALAHALLSERRRAHASPDSTRSRYTRAGDASFFPISAPQEKSAHIEARRRIAPTTPDTSETPGSEPAPRCSSANLPRAWNRRVRVGLGDELKKSGAPPHRFQRACSKRGIPGSSQVQRSPTRRVRITFQRCRTLGFGATRAPHEA
jgi:hypothetical protein